MKLPAVRLIVPGAAQYEELALHESLDRSDKGDGRTALKLYDLPFVEQMGERHRRPPCPPAAWPSRRSSTAGASTPTPSAAG